MCHIFIIHLYKHKYKYMYCDSFIISRMHAWRSPIGGFPTLGFGLVSCIFLILLGRVGTTLLMFSSHPPPPLSTLSSNAFFLLW